MADEKAKQAKPKTQRKAKAAPSVSEVEAAAAKVRANSNIPARVTWKRFFEMGVQAMVDELSK